MMRKTFETDVGKVAVVFLYQHSGFFDVGFY